MDIFLDIPKNGNDSAPQQIRITDHGLTLMRLSYAFDIDTPNKEKILRRILAENGVNEENGELYMEATPETLYTALLQFSQAVSKVGNMRYFKREVLASLFDELPAEFIQAELQRFKPQQTVYPLPDRDDLELGLFSERRATLPVWVEGCEPRAAGHDQLPGISAAQLEVQEHRGA